MLYLGMAGDIMAPLLLNPNVKTIYVISKFMSHFSSKGTWTSQKDDIRQILVNGNDNNTYSRDIYIEDSLTSLFIISNQNQYYLKIMMMVKYGDYHLNMMVDS